MGSSGSGGEGLGKRGEVVVGSGRKRSYGNEQYVFKSWGKGDRVYNRVVRRTHMNIFLNLDSELVVTDVSSSSSTNVINLERRHVGAFIDDGEKGETLVLFVPPEGQSRRGQIKTLRKWLSEEVEKVVSE
nr:hypothetical protein [Tanacetum cinerariifolium]